jgi:4-amino-4-deoxy-L-arabinose transferase-like glycosyltransferase
MKKWAEENQKLICIIFAAVIALGFVVTRIWRLNELPYGLHVDEAGMAYDAWSLANYGVDRWLKSWPVYLNNYGAGQSSLYCFLCAVLFKIFGYSVWIIRLPIVLFSALTLIFGMKTAYECFENSMLYTLITGALITFCPYFIMQGRFGLDCNLMLGASTVFLFFFTKALKYGQNKHYIAAGISGGILLYTYALSYPILICFLCVSVIYSIITRKLDIKKWFIMAVFMGVVATPIILVQIVNIFDLEEFMIGPFTIARINAYRVSEIGLFKIEYFMEAVKSIFVGDRYLFDTIPGIPNLYAITVPLFVVGFADLFGKLVKNIKLRNFESRAVVLLWFLTVFIFSCHITTYTYRINTIFFSVAFITTNGIKVLAEEFSKIYYVVLTAICLVYAVSALHFGAFYFFKYTDATFPLEYFGHTFDEAVELIENNEVLKNKLTYVSEIGIYYALSSKISPYDFDITGDECIKWNNYWFGSLQEITDDCNYIVYGNFEEYCEELRQAGFTEAQFDRYSVFYKE